MDLNSLPYDFEYGSKGPPQGNFSNGMQLHPHHDHQMHINQNRSIHGQNQNSHYFQDPYFQCLESNHDYEPSKRAVTYGGSSMQYHQVYHPPPTQHHQTHMTQQQSQQSQHDQFGDQQISRINHFSPQFSLHHHSQQQPLQSGHHNQLYPSPQSHQLQNSQHFDLSPNNYMDTSISPPSNNNHISGLPPTVTPQVSFPAFSPSQRSSNNNHNANNANNTNNNNNNNNSYYYNNNNSYECVSEEQSVCKFSVESPPSPSYEYFKSPLTSNHQRQPMLSANSSPLAVHGGSTWRKMFSAPNIRMNTTYKVKPSDSNRNRNQSPAVLFTRKLSVYRFSSQLRSHRVSASKNSSMTIYTPPPILTPIREGSGLFCRIARNPSEYYKRSVAFDMSTTNVMEEGQAGVLLFSARDSGISNDDVDLSSDQATPTSIAKKVTEKVSPWPRVPLVRPPIDNRANRPPRKNGLFLSKKEDSSNGLAAELEALRKESAESIASNCSIEKLRACSIRASTSAIPTNDDVIRKMSTVSMIEEGPIMRKTSTLSETYYDYQPLDTDPYPHVNLSKLHQARVKKWADREIMPHEREALKDRDECLFDPTVIDHLDEQTVAAYESLSCSAAVPKLGRNKELALHILMENKGNIQSAVMDLLRWDTLDWSQYPIIYNYKYNEVDNWTPEEVASFQDAIYKSEKDFHQVALELNNRDVKQCVEFYYMWKKACPDDYRKLRNLRRKSRLLMQQIDITAIKKEPDHCRDESSTEELESETDSERMHTPIDVVSSSPEDEARPAKMARYSSPLVSTPRKTSTIRCNEPEKEYNPGTMYPWLQCGDNGRLFMSPSPSSVSQPMSQSYSQPPSVGNSDSGNGHSNHGFTPDVLLTKIASIHRVSASKKGAQPSADGYFHCRLCDKRFEKVKSLNAHMKSHAMKARAEAEAQQQLQSQQHSRPTSSVPNANAAIDHARNLAILQHQQQQQQAQVAANNVSLLNNAAQIDAIQQQLNRSAASPLELSLQRISQFASPISFGANGINFLNPEMLQHLASLPQNQTVVSSAAALQQSLHNLQQAPIIN